VIATPVDFHKEMAIASLEVGKNVYCERPMAVTPEDCRQVTNAAGAAKGIFQQGFQNRHEPNRAASMEFIKKGGIGKVLFLQAYRNGGDLPRKTAWYFDRTRSGDIIVEQACHIIDLMAPMGPVASIYSRTSRLAGRQWITGPRSSNSPTIFGSASVNCISILRDLLGPKSASSDRWGRSTCYGDVQRTGEES